MLKKLKISNFCCHKDFEAEFKPGINCIIGNNGSGKDLSLNTPVLTPAGWKKNRDLRIGDEVIGRDGKATIVTGVYPQDMHKFYRVTFSDGTFIDCGDTHNWGVYDKWRTSGGYTHSKTRKKVNGQRGVYSILTTEQLANSLLYKIQSNGYKYWRYYIPMCDPIQFAERKKPPIDPWLLGILIGDGSLTNVSGLGFTNTEKDIIDRVNSCVNVFDCLVETHGDKTKNHYGITFKPGFRKQKHPIRKTLYDYGLSVKSCKRFIPDDYKFGSVETRIAVLQGLIDTDGHVDKSGAISYDSSSKQLAEDVQFMVQSLGGTAQLTLKTNCGYKDKKGDFVKCLDAYRLYIKCPICLVSSKKHLKRYKKRQFEAHRSIKKIERIADQSGVCITVAANDHLYLANDCIVTHNTTLLHALYGALTNSYEHPDGVRGVIRQGSEEAKIECVFDEFTITREISEKNKHLLKIGDQTCRAVRDIENELATRFNLAKAILDKFVFIRQGRFTEIIGLPDSDRAKTLAYLSNVEYFETLWKKLAEEMKTRENALISIPTFDEQTVKAQIEELDAQLKEAASKEAVITSELNGLSEPVCVQQLDLAQQLKTAKSLVESYTKEKTRLTAELSERDAQVFKLSAEYSEVEQTCNKVKLSNSEVDEMNAYGTYQANSHFIEAEQAELSELQAELQSLNKQEIIDVNVKLNAQIRQISDKQAKLQMQLRLAENASKNQECEVCGAPPEAQFKGNPSVISNTLQRTVKQRENLERQISENITRISVIDSKIARQNELTAKLQQINAQQFIDNETHYKTLQNRYQQQLQALTQLEKLKNELGMIVASRDSTRQHLNNIEKQSQESHNIIQNENKITEDAEHARKTLNRINELKIETVTLKTIISEKQNHVDSLNTLIKQIRQGRKQKRLQKYLALLGEVRTLTHRNNIPHQISKRFLTQLTAQINEFLKEFEAQFTVTVANDLGFRALMNSGASVPATALSGGQKATLAAAFWLSVFQSHGSRIGFLTLDEPGDGLDDANRKLFNNVLTRTDEIFRKSGHQLIIVSHDTQLSHLFHTIAV